MVFAAIELVFTLLWAELHGCTKDKLGNIHPDGIPFFKKVALVDECVKAGIFKLQEKI